jgi:hypothetical protein
MATGKRRVQTLETALLLLCLSGAGKTQTTLATFQLVEYFGIAWPPQNIEMRYDGGAPNSKTTRMLNANGLEIPYQWVSGAGCWDNTAVNGCILVQDGLAQNATNVYTLQSGIAPAAVVTNPVTVTSGTCRGGMAGWIIANGLTGFCVPKSQMQPFNYAPIQGLQLSDGTWTGAAQGQPNLIYHNPIMGTWPNSYSFNGIQGSNVTMSTQASIFTSETTSFVDAGPLKTSVQLSYTANKPVYYNWGGAYTKGATSSTISLSAASGVLDCSTPILYFTQNRPNPLPSGLQIDTIYYPSNCSLNGSTVTYSLSTSPGGPIISNIGPYQGQVNAVLAATNSSGPGHLTVILTLYANRPSFSYDFDTDLNVQDFVPLYAEVQPDTRRYRGTGSSSAACGYESPLTITNITNTTPPTVTVSNPLNAVNGNQVTISGVNGATGANGTFYACSVNNSAGTFTLHSSSGCNAPAPAPGAYSSGGVGKPQYTVVSVRFPRDAFYDIAYNANYTAKPGTCTPSSIPTLDVNVLSNWTDGGYYDMVYNSAGGNSSPIVGLFEGRLSKLYNISGNGQPGWFASNNHWNSSYNVQCAAGSCAFGIEHMVKLSMRAPLMHGNFGIYVGTVGQLQPPDATQQIKREQNAFEGINLSSLYTYMLNYPDPQPNNPPNYGWTWPYMNNVDFNNWVNLFQHSTSFCSSTGSCLGDSGYYNVMRASEGTSRAIQDMWHFNDTPHATTAYNQVLASGSGGERRVAASGYWSGGTATITIGPHNISVGQIITVVAVTPAGYNCAVCVVTGVTPTAVSYSLTSNPGTFGGGGFVKEIGVPGFVNVLANGDNLWQPATTYYQLYFNQFGPQFAQCTAIILNANTAASQKSECKRILALAGSLIWDNDWFPIGGINGTGQTTSGDDGGLANQQVQYSQYRSEASSQLYFHPYLATKVAAGNTYTAGVYSSFTDPYGAGAASLHYQEAYTVPTYQAFQTTALTGATPQISFTDGSYRWQRHVQWYLSGLTPPEPRFGAARKCLSDGDGNTEGACASQLGMMAEGLSLSDPATAGNAMWGWAQTNYPNTFYNVDQQTVWLVNPLVPQIPPTLSSLNFPGYWSVARYGFGTPYETSVHFINGSFYSVQGHRHYDDGQVSIYALSAPLAIDWNANLYSPDTRASFCHNRIVLDSEIQSFGAWNNDAPDCSAIDGPYLTANETNFNAFSKSTQSIATFTYGDGSVWTRQVRTMDADPAYPLIYVKDSFSGPSATAPKTLTWNLMATGSVVTPAGVVTPTVRFSGPPNAATGCNLVAAQYPSNGTVYSLANGPQQFTFTGATWKAHATGGINWDLWEIPSSGAAQFLIGNWGHGCNASLEMSEFQATNGVPFNERQHILRVHDTGTFETLIAPYRNGETPMRTVNTQSCGTQIVQGSETTCFNDSALTYTNGNIQVLTVYDTSSQSAYGMAATGGAQELVNNGAGTIAWTIEDTVAGTRCITLPAGASLAGGGTGVQYNAATGQYCYSQGASPQPTPVSITFALQ